MSETTEEMVTITKKEYDQLVENSDWLGDLEAAGVDNWQGYDDAQDLRDARQSE